MNQQQFRIREVQPSILYFGTPVVLLSTLNEDETTNLTPMSSAWALGQRIVLGLGAGGKALMNLQRWEECVINLPDPSLWQHVERLAPLTGCDPVPVAKQGQYKHEKDKFSAAGLSPLPSMTVKPQRIAECPLQIEARVLHIQMASEDASFAIIETGALKVHAYEPIVLGDRHIDPSAWSPLIYNFRHYFGLGGELGKTFRSET
ncbi:flavin reductase family protein [Paenibacillus sedimenti]|uniref:Flavin reductase family protein n=1 Tax=Paenibacillus sedimenti TaxID=2770274 RepID=A0A926KQF1_9BACL|nr:flavin reductase family protein [Paenibacillus sedimenti]MBD0382159.1 flavin reductase family protein [Paenibacillus sedimenti]